MRVGHLLVLSLALALLAPSLPAATTEGALQARTVARDLAAPAPFDDAAYFRVQVPEGVVVQVVAEGSPGTLVELEAHPEGEGAWGTEAPGPAKGRFLGHAGAWLVRVDPFLGPSSVAVTFAGFAADAGGDPAAFTLTDLPDGCACWRGVSLP